MIPPRLTPQMSLPDAPEVNPAPGAIPVRLPTSTPETDPRLPRFRPDGMTGKEHAPRPHAEPAALMLPKLDQPVERLAVDQRLEVRPDQHIGRQARPSPGRAPRGSDGPAPAVDPVPDLGDEGEPLRPRPSPSASKSTATKGASSTVMPDLFDRGDKEIVVALALEDRREQLHQLRSARSACPGRTMCRRARCACRYRRRTAGSTDAPAAGPFAAARALCTEAITLSADGFTIICPLIAFCHLCRAG